jgi:hypothetical protein
MITFFWHSKLPTYNVSLAYHSMYTKSLQFPLGVTMMSYNMSNNISKRTTQAVIGAVHVNRSLLHILAFTGTKLLGLRLRHHCCAQGSSHIKQVIQHTRQQDENGKMCKIILDYGQLLAGVHYPILQYPKPKLPHIKDPLIATIPAKYCHPKYIHTTTTLWEQPEHHELDPKDQEKHKHNQES